jgi:hypothetical protein
MSRDLTVAEVAARMNKPVPHIVTRLRNLGIEVQDGGDEINSAEISALLVGRPPDRRHEELTRHVEPPVQAGREASVFDSTASVAPTLVPVKLSASDGELMMVLRDLIVRNRVETTDEVFVVHGHDDVRHTVSELIASVSLRPVMLDGRPNRGRTIIEKLEDHANTSFAVVLLTPDDEGRKRGSRGFRPRARQNVILELGYFLARLGRQRVCALYVAGVELPSDFHGVLYIELDSGGTWRKLLLGELLAAGLPVRRRMGLASRDNS